MGDIFGEEVFVCGYAALILNIQVTIHTYVPQNLDLKIIQLSQLVGGVGGWGTLLVMQL